MTISQQASSLTTGYYVWGHDPSASYGTYTKYLGFFTCVFCQEYASESINNQYGTYGSPYSSSSIRNQYGQWGGQYSSYSPCNQYANTPPRVYNANSSVYYGELTLNQYRADAIKDTNIVNWLARDVCNH